MSLLVRFGNISLVRYFFIKPFLKIEGLSYFPFADYYLKWGAIENPQSNTILCEDGFIRSKGLGVHFSPPCSLVFDRSGIYFDARRTSDLEFLLNNYDLCEEMLLRSEALIHRLIDSDISKYNVGEYTIERCFPSDKKIILVPGQVEGDASIVYGSPVVKTNLDLVKQVRREHPGSYIIYKPHPDVVAKQRCGGEIELIKLIANDVVTKQSITSLFSVVDEVHTMTSLAGFEALLRNKKVVAYGVPFYSGWGLTIDKVDCVRRTRTRTLAELVACALILYPTYRHPLRKCQCEVEDIIHYIDSFKASSGLPSMFQRVLLTLKKLRNRLV
ncbi:capsular polysaccharide export protein, LipB/KpsS family [Vibrio sinaloensis]|uniref:capsular polysaccharide export protein, LipB/KpsS family n=1 Tax=Photobacterium sp. (strain ATCC 43367) TaxID=379097 RepID=UPI0035EBFE38